MLHYMASPLRNSDHATGIEQATSSGTQPLWVECTESSEEHSPLPPQTVLLGFIEDGILAVGVA